MKKIIAVFCLMITSSTVMAEPNLLAQFNQRAEQNYKQTIYKIVSHVAKAPRIRNLNLEGQPVVLPKSSEYLALITTRTNDLCGIKEETASRPDLRVFSITCYDSEGRQFIEFSSEAKKSSFYFEK